MSGRRYSAQVRPLPTFTGQPPIFLSPQALSPEVYRQLERHWDKLWEIPGVARNLGTGSKPQGVISGQGQRDAKDITSQRFAVVQQRWDKWHLKVAGAVIDEAKEIYQENKKFEVSANDSKLLEKIDWAKVNLDECGPWPHAPTVVLCGRDPRCVRAPTAAAWPRRGSARRDHPGRDCREGAPP